VKVVVALAATEEDPGAEIESIVTLLAEPPLGVPEIVSVALPSFAIVYVNVCWSPAVTLP
jgi:hypothetical protein